MSDINMINISPARKLLDILIPAFAPCINFSKECEALCWEPKAGHVPRGFLGATSSIENVELVLVFAEPGDPHPTEIHESIATTLEHTYFSMKEGDDVFHKNLRYILDLFFPDLNFDAKLEKTWMTESVLCSAIKECGTVSSKIADVCTKTYLLPQLSLFRNATIVAVGSKARDRLRRQGIDAIYIAHPSPPGANRKCSKESWKNAADIHRKRYQTALKS